MPRNYELRIDAAYRVTRDATRFVSIMLSGGLFSFFLFEIIGRVVGDRLDRSRNIFEY